MTTAMATQNHKKMRRKRVFISRLPRRPHIEITHTTYRLDPFSSAVRTGNLLFLSGQIGTRVENGVPTLVSGGIDAEARQAMDNIREVLEYAGTSMDRVVKCSVMMADMSEWPRLNEIYETYFPGAKPARSAWGATGLALGARVEIECVAAIE